MVNAEHDQYVAPEDPAPNGDGRPALPEFVLISQAELQSFPSPGTQRALKAETGRDYMAMVGPDADSADRTQTQIWTFLRRTIRDLRWEDCADITLQLADNDRGMADPTVPGSSATSPGSAVSGA